MCITKLGVPMSFIWLRNEVYFAIASIIDNQTKLELGFTKMYFRIWPPYAQEYLVTDMRSLQYLVLL